MYSKMLRKIQFVVFGRSNIKFELKILQYIPRIHVKFFARTCVPTPPNGYQKFWNYAHFSSFSSQIYKTLKFFRAMNFCRTEKFNI